MILLPATIALRTTPTAFVNLIGYDSNGPFVRHVLAMDTIFRTRAPNKYRAIHSLLLQRGGYALIIAVEALLAGRGMLFSIARRFGITVAAAAVVCGRGYFRGSIVTGRTRPDAPACYAAAPPSSTMLPYVRLRRS